MAKSKTLSLDDPSLSPAPPPHPTVGLALGSGSARGWAHIGVIQTLGEAGVPIDYVAGSSIGALVGGVFCAGQLDTLAREARHLDWRRLVRMLDIALPRSGLLAGEKITAFIRQLTGERPLTTLPTPFWAVATDLRTGREVWIRQGSIADAIRASMSVPGILTPIRYGPQWLVDGGLANPVPVSVCRAMGADIVIAVNLNADILLRPEKPQSPPTAGTGTSRGRRLQHTFRYYWQQRGKQFRQLLPPLPRRAREPSLSIFEVVLYSLHVMQDRITRHRLAADPPDFLITPAVRHIQLLEFHRADEAIAEGTRAAQALLPAIRESIERTP
ncbi:MAG: patatin-like phospholipase family protein [Thermodesulfobacteriota bacterium]